MRILRRIVLIFLAVILQLCLVVLFTCPPVNLAKISYRQAERAAVLETLAHSRTPENEAAYMQELHLASQHIHKQQFILTGEVLAGILSIEGLLIYLGRKHDYKYKAVA